MSAATDLSFCRAERLPFRRLDDETVIINPTSREVHVLNGTGSRLWDLLEAPHTVPELVRTIVREGELDVGEETVTHDVISFLDELVHKGLLLVARTDGRAA